ncbi:hypothetical protein CMK12_04915 [Candidatus Poribacteria bacterium]|nr:hypothetical protein [Candidatus Poribacteria bacterium]
MSWPLLYKLHLQVESKNINIISTVTNQGKVRFMIYDEKMTAPVLIRFRNRLLREAKKKVCLILDHLRVDHAKLVKS